MCEEVELSCITIVIVGVFLMVGPEEIWGNEPPTATSMDEVNPAVRCTVLLATMFFTVYFLVAVNKTAVEISGRTPSITKLEGTLVIARYIVNFAPMLTMLFLGARIGEGIPAEHPLVAWLVRHTAWILSVKLGGEDANHPGRPGNGIESHRASA